MRLQYTAPNNWEPLTFRTESNSSKKKEKEAGWYDVTLWLFLAFDYAFDYYYHHSIIKVVLLLYLETVKVY